MRAVLLFILMLHAGGSLAQVVQNESATDVYEQVQTIASAPANYPALRVTRALSSERSGPFAKSVENGSAPGTASPAANQPTYGPLPPNQFQHFVLQTTGQLLPLHGFNLFTSGKGFAPGGLVPVPADYILGPGDEVIVRAWGSIDIEHRAVVDRNGLIVIPQLGTIALNGVRADNVESVIRAAVGKNFRAFSLSVSLGPVRGITVYLVGQARKPGSYVVSGLSTLVSALFEAGGPNENGSLRHIQVKRGGNQIAELDFYAFLSQGDKRGDIKLLDGDVIVIPPVAGYMAMTGEIPTPAIFEILDGKDRVGDIIGLAGGLPVMADPRRAYLERVNPGQSQPISIEEFALDAAGLEKTLRSGDLLSVAAIVPAFDNAVTLRGSVKQAMRVPFRPGMRITDLIPNREALLSKLTIRLQNNALLEHARQETQREKGLFPQQTSAWTQANTLASGNSMEIYATETERSTSLDVVGNAWDEINWDYAVVERINRTDMTSSLVPFDLGRALADPESSDNLMLSNGDRVTVFSAYDVRIPISRRRVLVRIEGEVQRPGIYQVSAGEDLSKLLNRAGGLTQDAYLYGAEFYREAVRQSQQTNLDKFIRQLEQENLSASPRQANMPDNNSDSGDRSKVNKTREARERLLQRMRSVKSNGRIALGLSYQSPSIDQLPKFKLENNDRLVIPSRPDYVQIYGAVNSESALFWQPGKSVGDYLALVGVSKEADEEGIFVMRADSTVVRNGGGWFSTANDLPSQPGDIVVVRDKPDYENGWATFFRSAKDWTQILYQLGLGAAAFKSLD